MAMENPTNRKQSPARRSRRSVLKVIGGGAIAPVVAGCTVLDARDDTRYSVEMTPGYRFNPGSITIPVGGTVAWRNLASTAHTTTTDASLVTDPDEIVLPEGAEPWNSDEILTGQVWDHTFTVPGTYVYACRLHQGNGMIGTIVVEE